MLACVGGLLLIAIPPVAFSLFGPDRPLLSSVPGRPIHQAIPDDRVLSLQPAAPANQDATGRLVVLGRRLDGEVVRNYQEKPASGSVGWHSIGGNIQGKPVVILNPDGEMSGFAIDVKGRLRQHTSVSARFPASSDWKNLNGQDLVGTPAVALDSEDRFVVFARDTGGELWVRYQTESGGEDWLPWRKVPGPPVLGDPVIVRDGLQKLRVFALGSGNQIQTLTQEKPGTNGWSSGRIPGAVANSSPAVTMDARSRLRVFTIDPAGTLQTITESAPSSEKWRDWQDHPGPPLTGKPVAATDANNTVVVFAIHQDSHRLMHLYEGTRAEGESGEPTWAPWADLDGSLSELETAVNDANGHLVVFGIGTNGTMAQNFQQERAAGPWVGWQFSFGGGSFPQQSDSP